MTTDIGDKMYYARLESDAARASGWPGAESPALEKLDAIQREMAWLTYNRDLLLGLCEGRWESEGGRVFDKNNLWQSTLGTYGLTEQCLRVFRAWAIQKGLLAGEHKAAAEALKLHFVDPVALKQSLEAQNELARLQSIIDRICMETGDRQRAMAIYNRDPAPRSEAKITNWIRGLVEAGLLPASWLIGRASLSEVLGKMLDPRRSNKMIDPREENK